MITLLLHLPSLFPFLCGGQRQLALENLALRHQLTVYTRSVPRPRLRTMDRLLWVGLARAWTGWRQALVIVTPASTGPRAPAGLGWAVHRVCYEDVVEDLEGNVRRILEFCGLEFEPACVEFYKRERAVSTVRSEQVRRPIFGDGLARPAQGQVGRCTDPLR